MQADVDASVDLRSAVVERLCADPRLLVDLFKRCGQRELDLVVSIGGWGGLGLGLFQMFAWAAFPASWTLAAGGADTKLCEDGSRRRRGRGRGYSAETSRGHFNPTTPAQAAGGALVGLVTDWAALKILFSPVEPRRFFGLKVHGLFLRRQAEVSRDFGAFVASELVAPRHLWAALLAGPRRSNVADRIADALAAELPADVGADIRKRLVAVSARGAAEMAADPAAYVRRRGLFLRRIAATPRPRRGYSVVDIRPRRARASGTPTRRRTSSPIPCASSRPSSTRSARCPAPSSSACCTPSSSRTR